MYSGLLLMSFVLVEYVMTNKDWSGLGTEDWAICRLEFIFLDILVHRPITFLQERKILFKKPPNFLWWYNSKDIHLYSCTKWRKYRRLLAWKKIQINLSVFFSLSGSSVVWSWDAHSLVRSNDVLRFWWERGHNKTSMALTWKTITDITERWRIQWKVTDNHTFHCQRLKSRHQTCWFTSLSGSWFCCGESQTIPTAFLWIEYSPS